MNKHTTFSIGLLSTFAISLVIASVFIGTAAAQAPLSPQEKPGRQIYLEETNPLNSGVLPSDPKPLIGEKIEIGTILPSTGPLAEMGSAVKSVIAAAFAEENLKGGIHRRQLELKVIETGDSPAATRVNLDRLIKTENIFALTGALIPGAETEIVDLLDEQEVPLIGPLTLDPKVGSPLNRQVFYLLSGTPDQGRALLRFILNKSNSKHPSLAVIYSSGQFYSHVLSAINEQIEKEDLKSPLVFEYEVGTFDATSIVSQVRQTDPEAIFFVGRSENLNAFLREADRIGWFPKILLPDATSSSDIFGAPAGFQNKIYWTVPTSPSDQTTEGTREFQALAEKHNLPSKHLATQVSVYAATKILIDALKQVGPDLTRERLIQVLENLHGYQTGLTPEITYDPNRRIGAMGAYVVMVDLKGKRFVPVSRWISVN